MIDYISIPIEIALIVHDRAIKRYGGLEGIHNIGILESVLENIKNDVYYPKPIDKLAHLFFSIIKFHCFADGNKRTAVTCFLLSFREDYSIYELESLEKLALAVASGSMGKKKLRTELLRVFPELR